VNENDLFILKRVAELSYLDDCNVMQIRPKELLALTEEVLRLREALGDLLLSADASWETNDMGHDWRDACKAARAMLLENDNA
jgi:hypothetical protein